MIEHYCCLHSAYLDTIFFLGNRLQRKMLLLGLNSIPAKVWAKEVSALYHIAIAMVGHMAVLKVAK